MAVGQLRSLHWASGDVERSTTSPIEEENVDDMCDDETMDGEAEEDKEEEGRGVDATAARVRFLEKAKTGETRGVRFCSSSCPLARLPTGVIVDVAVAVTVGELVVSAARRAAGVLRRAAVDDGAHAGMMLRTSVCSSASNTGTKDASAWRDEGGMGT